MDGNDEEWNGGFLNSRRLSKGGERSIRERLITAEILGGL